MEVFVATRVGADTGTACAWVMRRRRVQIDHDPWCRSRNKAWWKKVIFVIVIIYGVIIGAHFDRVHAHRRDFVERFGRVALVVVVVSLRSSITTTVYRYVTNKFVSGDWSGKSSLIKLFERESCDMNYLRHDIVAVTFLLYVILGAL